ncbi:MAG: H-NS family nucleoid-associated regulatory protein [Methylococcales bacterium]
MQTNFNKLTETDLEDVIAKAEKELQTRKDKKRKEVLTEIKQLAASIGVMVEISESGRRSSRKGQKVPPKYQNPANPLQQWSGRGMKPNWLKELVEKGQTLEEFEI